MTYYDLATHERVELSSTTTANWVAKTSNFLTQELDATVGTRLRIGLPSHWMRIVWVLAAWRTGVIITDRGADIGLSGPELVGDEPLLLAASLRPLGGRFAEAPHGFIDIAVEVPSQPDLYLGIEDPDPGSIAVDLAGSTLTHAEFIDSAAADSQRRLVKPGPLLRDAQAITAAATGGGSIVIVSNAADEDLDRIADQEKATFVG